MSNANGIFLLKDQAITFVLVWVVFLAQDVYSMAAEMNSDGVIR